MTNSLRSVQLTFMLLMGIQVQSQTFSFDKLKDLISLDSKKFISTLKELNFQLKKNQVEDPSVADFTEIDKYEFKKESTKETVIIRNNIGRRTLNYLFFNKAHYILIKNQVQKNFSLVDYEDDELISTETYRSGNQTVKILHMKSIKNYSVFLTIKM